MNPRRRKRLAEKEIVFLKNKAYSFEKDADYVSAAKLRVSTGEIRKAISNYREAARLYNSCAEDYSAEHYSDSEVLSKFGPMYKQRADRCQKNADRLRKVVKGKWHGLENTTMTASIVGLIGGIFFLSPNLTGNVIGNMTNSTSNIIGAILFAVGIAGAFFYFRKR
ncbi:MAG: DUF308 domain-containing protein [Nanoarchaeota archaeon]